MAQTEQTFIRPTEGINTNTKNREIELALTCSGCGLELGLAGSVAANIYILVAGVEGGEAGVEDVQGARGPTRLPPSLLRRIR